MKKPFLILACIAIGSFYAYKHWLQTPYYHAKSYVFGTLVDITIIGEKDAHARALANHILSDFQSLHNRLHAWKPMAENQPSELQILNTGFAQNTAVNVSVDMTKMLQEIMKLSKQSEGFFNPAIGGLINLWGFQRDAFSAIAIMPDKINALVKANPSMADIQISANTISSKNKAVQLDFGGYAKGYALDRAAAYLTAQQVKHALINIGGNIIALGDHDGQPWRVGIQHPRRPEALATIALQDGWAIGTSGDYQRYFELDGKRYCHLINPKTGYPVQHTQAVTVLIPPQAPQQIQAGVLSDVLSKPIFIADFAHKVEMAKRLKVSHYLVVDKNGTLYASPAMQAQLAWKQDNATFKNFQ